METAKVDLTNIKIIPQCGMSIGACLIFVGKYPKRIVNTPRDRRCRPKRTNPDPCPWVTQGESEGTVKDKLQCTQCGNKNLTQYDNDPIWGNSLVCDNCEISFEIEEEDDEDDEG
jgi:hypothetical protein